MNRISASDAPTAAPILGMAAERWENEGGATGAPVTAPSSAERSPRPGERRPGPAGAESDEPGAAP
jgi:hypothetical protein